jgi:tetratricopeptide (TPR) repeat protein
MIINRLYGGNELYREVHMQPHRSLYILMVALVSLVVFTVPAPGQLAEEPEGVYSEYMLGTYRLEEGDVAGAVEHFERAWRLSAHDPGVGLRLAESYYLLKNFTRCELVVDDVIEALPDDPDALVMKAKVRYIQRDARSAVSYLEKVREIQRSSFEVERLLGNIYYEVGDAVQALEAYRRCLAIDPGFPYIQYRYARLLLMDGQAVAAEKAFRTAMDLDPSFVEPELGLIDLLIDDGRAEEALPYLEGLLEKDPRNEDAMVSLGTIYLEAGRHAEGIALLEKWREHSPLSQEGDVLLGRLYFESGDHDGAREVFERIFQGNPGSAELARILGELALKSGKVVEAREYFDRAIAAAPDEYRSYLALFFAASPSFAQSAGSEHVIDMSDDARKALLTRASGLAPGSEFEPNYLVGVSLLSMDMFDDAERHLLRAHELRADDFNTLFNLATVFEKQRKYERAEPYLAAMIALRPDDPTALNFYGYLLAEMSRDLPRALEMVQKALAADPENGYYLDSLGWIYYQMGDYARAVVELEKACTFVNEDPIILEHLGDAYAGMRRYKEALAAYERSHELQGDDGDILQKIRSATRENR